MLSNATTTSYDSVSYQVANGPLANNKFTIDEKFKVLSSDINFSSLDHENANGHDVMFGVGSGPYDIPADAVTLRKR